MRDILFKAKRISDGQWVEGFISYPHSTDTEKGVESYYFMAVDEMGWYGQCVVSADTICQYTGLTDKNGKKIWENDVVKVSERGVEISGGFIAFFNDYPGGWLITNKTMEAKCCLSRRNDVEVIGNIFDNQELLKGGAE